MKCGAGWAITAFMIICLLGSLGLADEPKADEAKVEVLGAEVKGEIQFRYDWLGIRKDRGRFREDNWMTDRSTGGLDWLRVESTRPDKNGYEWLLEARGLYDYDYNLSLLIKKKDSHYFKLDFSNLRRYFDNSNEYWNEGVEHMIERSDSDIFVDRTNFNLELGLTPPEGPQWVFGWHRLVKDGKEVLLRGSRRDAGSSYSIPDIVNLRAITDTIYGEVSHTFADKYNFRVRQEFEQHRGDQHGFEGARFNDDWSFDSGPTDSDDRRFRSHPGYTNWRTMAMFDTFPDERTYVTANYMFNYLHDNSTYQYYRLPRYGLYKDETSVDNKKRTHVGAFGYRRADVLQIAHLDLSAGVRIESSKTRSRSRYRYGSSLTPYSLASNLDELRIGEEVRLVYKGIERTVLSFDAKLEQRRLDWSARRTPSYNQIDRDTDTDFLDQIYTIKGVHRFNRTVKSTVKFRMKDLERSDVNSYRLNTTVEDYPGWLGDYRRRGYDVTVKTDFRLNRATSATLLYQFLQESMDFELGGKTQNLEIHRGAGSLSCNPAQNLVLVGTFMLESYALDTPAAGTSDVPARSKYDFKGNSYSLLLDGIYAFNKKTSCNLSFRHTEALGTVDDASDYIYNKAALTLKHQFTPHQAIGVGYEFYNFNNHGGGDFDDYIGHGASVTYTYSF